MSAVKMLAVLLLMVASLTVAALIGLDLQCDRLAQSDPAAYTAAGCGR